MSFAVVWIVATFSLQSRLGELAGEYVTALEAGDGARAYAMLCPAAQAVTSPDELGGLAAELGGIELLEDSLRGSGSRGLWRPSTRRGQGGVILRVDGDEQTRYLDMRDDVG